VKPIKIIGTGAALPSRVVHNDDLAVELDTSDEWIRERTGIRERRILEDGRATSDLAADALVEACSEAEVLPGELDAIIVGTSSPDAVFPSTACWVQHKLGISGRPAFDVMAGCSSWIYALEVAAGLLAAGTARRVGVIGAECMSRVIDWSDRRTCVLFGDGAGAAIVTASTGASGIVASNWACDGTLAEILCVPAGGTRRPASRESVEERAHFLHMEGSRVFIHAVKAMSGGVLRALADGGLTAADVDLFIPHQANSRIMEATRERTGIPAERVHSILDKYGNISAASVPVALHEARQAGRVRDGSMVALTAFGTGLTWGTALLRW
jgi:3-oxoacyl-[acyl-carrier-protein] synthase-3